MRISTRKSYKTYKGIMSRKDYFKALDIFNELLFEEMIKTGDPFEMPSRLGTLQILKFRPKKPSIDFYNTKKYGKTIRHENNLTDGYVIALYWKKTKATFKHKSSWNFDRVRRLKRNKLTELITTYGVNHIYETHANY